MRGHELRCLAVTELVVVGVQHFIEAAAVDLDRLRLGHQLAQGDGALGGIGHQSGGIGRLYRRFDAAALSGDLGGESFDGLLLRRMHAIDRAVFVGDQPGLP